MRRRNINRNANNTIWAETPENRGHTLSRFTTTATQPYVSGYCKEGNLHHPSAATKLISVLLQSATTTGHLRLFAKRDVLSHDWRVILLGYSVSLGSNSYHWWTHSLPASTTWNCVVPQPSISINTGRGGQHLSGTCHILLKMYRVPPSGGSRSHLGRIKFGTAPN
jgi:hypothetical protein